MPDHPFTLNTNRLAIKSRFLYGLGGSEEVSELEQRLQNCVVLENDRIESRLAGQELECGVVGTSPAGGAGLISQIGLLIPRQSNIVVTLEQATALSGGGAINENFRRQYTTGGSIDANNPIARDSRAGSSRVPACRCVFVNGAAAAVGSFWWSQAINTVYEGGFVAAGSDTTDVILWIDHGVLNAGITGCFLWRERVLEGGLLS